jgi:ferredoxin
LAISLLDKENARRRAMTSGYIVADASRCVACGICVFNCPLGTDIRARVRDGLPIADKRCLTCGECVARCPRGTLRFEVSPVFARPAMAAPAIPALAAPLRRATA